MAQTLHSTKKSLSFLSNMDTQIFQLPTLYHPDNVLLLNIQHGEIYGTEITCTHFLAHNRIGCDIFFFSKRLSNGLGLRQLSW